MFPDLIKGQSQNIFSSFLFTSNDELEGFGLRMRFSFHPENLKPQQVAGSEAKGGVQWNCSVSVWPDLLGHFPCDLVPQCAESEDEAPCPYTSDKCGVNKVQAGRNCYFYLREAYRTWHDADRDCRRSGSFLHVTHEMLACDVASVCRTVDSTEGWYSNVCQVSLGLTHVYFYCGVSGDFVPYSLVCDFRTDCGDRGDEDFCVHPACTGTMINCGQGQCVDFQKTCDGYNDCATNLDEASCPELTNIYEIKPPAVVQFDRPGGFTVTPLSANTTQCPDTHFQCHDDGYCLPVYVRCNDVNDCPDHEDELWCNGYRCPGFYRCRGTDRTICVHVDHLCDGLPQCPRHDDELMCDLTCPESCTCYGLAFTCTHTFQCLH
ncbi:hypothetical protein ACOMHN_016524 [Nucella lapillus]